MGYKIIVIGVLFVLAVEFGVCQDNKKPEPQPAFDSKPIPLKDQLPNTWIKRSPLKDAPLSPMLGYEGSFGYDTNARLVIRWAGHNQGGGGEQNAET